MDSAKAASIVFAPPTSASSQEARRAHVERVFAPEFVSECWQTYTQSLGLSFPVSSASRPLRVWQKKTGGEGSEYKRKLGENF